MVGIVVNPVNPVAHQAPGNVNLAADDWLYPGCFRRFVKVNTAIHHTMIGNGNGILPQLLYPLHHPVNAAGPVQKAVFCMYMKMDKAHGFPSIASSTNLFSR